MTAFVTLPAVILLAAIAYAVCCIFRFQAQADRENAAAELIAQTKRLEHQQRLERVHPQAPGRHRLRDTPLA